MKNKQNGKYGKEVKHQVDSADFCISPASDLTTRAAAI
jgi:hypothetical protein